MDPSRIRNPWRDRPLAICATPIVGVLVQMNAMAAASMLEGGPSGLREFLASVLFFGSLFLPVAALPALLAAIRGRHAALHRPWYVAGIVLNAFYVLFLAFPLLVLATFLIRHPLR